MACITSLWEHGEGPVADQARAQCSDPGLPFPGDNKAAEAYCGVDFSFFDWTNTPITEYCVRRLEAPPAPPPLPVVGTEVGTSTGAFAYNP